MSIDDCCEIKQSYVVDILEYKTVLYRVAGIDVNEHLVVENVYRKEHGGDRLVEHMEYYGSDSTADEMYKMLKEHYDKLFEQEVYHGSVVS